MTGYAPSLISPFLTRCMPNNILSGPTAAASRLLKILDNLGTYDRVIIHTHRDPRTGVLSVMRDLCKAQNEQDSTLAVILAPCSKSYLASQQGSQLLGMNLHVLAFPAWAALESLTLAYLGFSLANPIRRFLRGIAGHHSSKVYVHSHSAWLTGAFLPLSGVTVISTYHGLACDQTLPGQPMRRYIHRLWASRTRDLSDCVTSVSSDIGPRLQSLFGIDPGWIRFVPNGTFASVSTKAPRNQITIGFAGQLTKGKGWKICFDAVRNLRAKGTIIHLIIAGTGPDLSAAQTLCRQFPAEATFLGHVDNMDATFYQRVDFVVLMSDSEGMPMVAVEALARGIPVIATSVGAIPDMARLGGVLVVPRDSRSLEEAIENLLDDSVARRELTKAAETAGKTYYDIRRVAREYDQLYAGDTKIVVRP